MTPPLGTFPKIHPFWQRHPSLKIFDKFCVICFFVVAEISWGKKQEYDVKYKSQTGHSAPCFIPIFVYFFA